MRERVGRPPVAPGPRPAARPPQADQETQPPSPSPPLRHTVSVHSAPVSPKSFFVVNHLPPSFGPPCSVEELAEAVVGEELLQQENRPGELQRAASEILTGQGRPTAVLAGLHCTDAELASFTLA